MDDMFEFSDEIRAFVKSNAKLNDSDSIDRVLSFLKEKNISQVRSVYLLTSEAGIPFNVANQLVLNSKAWNNSLSK